MAMYALSLFFLTGLISGVKVAGGFWTFVLGGLILTLLFIVLRPILGLITLPLNFLSLGSFSFIINAFLLYVLTILIPEISIKAFTFQGVNLAGFIIPKFYFNTFFTFIVSSIVLSLTKFSMDWIIQE